MSSYVICHMSYVICHMSYDIYAAGVREGVKNPSDRKFLLRGKPPLLSPLAEWKYRSARLHKDLLAETTNQIMFTLIFLFQTIFLHCIEQHEGEVTFSETQKLARKQKQHFCRVERPCWLMGFTQRESCVKSTQKCEQMCQPPGDHDAAQVSAALQHCGQLQGCGDRLHQV